MAKPMRNASPENIKSSTRTFFATTKTFEGTCLFQSERNAMLLVDVLCSCGRTGKFQVHDFVVMPDHVHLLLTVHAGMTIERAMQLIKGGFSYRLRKECGYVGEVWQRGFSEERLDSDQSYKRCREYIAM